MNTFTSIGAKLGLDISDFNKGLAAAQNGAAKLQGALRAGGLRGPARLLGYAAPIYAAIVAFRIMDEEAKKAQEAEDKRFNVQLEHAKKIAETSADANEIATAWDNLGEFSSKMDENTRSLIIFDKQLDKLKSGIANLGINVLEPIARMTQAEIINAQYLISSFFGNNEAAAQLTRKQALADIGKAPPLTPEQNAEILQAKEDVAAGKAKSLDKAKDEDVTAIQDYAEKNGSTSDKLDAANKAVTSAIKANEATEAGSQEFFETQTAVIKAMEKRDELQEKQNSLQKEENELNAKHAELLEKEKSLTQQLEDIRKQGIAAEAVKADTLEDQIEKQKTVNGLLEQYNATDAKITETKKQQADLQDRLQKAQEEHARSLRTQYEVSESDITSGKYGTAQDRAALRQAALLGENAKRAYTSGNTSLGDSYAAQAERFRGKVHSRETDQKQVSEGVFVQEMKDIKDELAAVNKKLDPVTISTQ